MVDLICKYCKYKKIDINYSYTECLHDLTNSCNRIILDLFQDNINEICWGKEK